MTSLRHFALCTRGLLSGGLAILLLIWPGCGRPAGTIFPQDNRRFVWPPPPDTPRVAYVGELRGEESLKAARSGWQVLRESLTGEASAMSFSTPTAVAVRGDCVAVSDTQHRAVFVLDLNARTWTTIAAAGASGFDVPVDVVFAGEQLAVADSRRAVVYLLEQDGRLVRTIGEGVLQRPCNLAYDAGRDELWVLDAALHSAIAFSLDGRELRRIGGRGAGAAHLNFPAGLTSHAQLGLVVADSMNFRVQVFSREGSPGLAIGQKGDAAGDFALPRDVAVDSEGHLYVLDNQFENVQIFDAQGRLLMAFGEEGTGPGQFALPSGITIDDRDRIWIADTYNRRIQVFQYLKEVSP